VTKPIALHDYAWIGHGAMLLPGCVIGAGAIVGAGAVVSRSVAVRGIVVGNPARPLTRRREESLRYIPVLNIASVKCWIGANGDRFARVACRDKTGGWIG
jgi:maltose O-acetyltransferase